MNKDLNFYRDLCEKLINTNYLLSLGLGCEEVKFTWAENDYICDVLKTISDSGLPKFQRPTIFDAKDENGLSRKLYISSRMTGIKYYNFPAFFSCDEQMSIEGWRVINPARIDLENAIDPYSIPDDWDWNQPPPNTTYEEIIKRDLEELERCDAILLFGDWRNSMGAKLELAKALGWGLDVYEIE